MWKAGWEFPRIRDFGRWKTDAAYGYLFHSSEPQRGLLVGGGRGSSDGSLNNKVDSLAQEMRQLMARGGGGGAPSTIVMQGGGGGGAVRGFVMLVLPGAAGYVYLKYMGYDIADLKWVSASRFQEAIASLGKAQEVLDTKLLAFRTSAEQALSEAQLALST